MRSGGRWAVAVALLAGVVFAWSTYVRYFDLHPGPMVAALLTLSAPITSRVMRTVIDGGLLPY